MMKKTTKISIANLVVRIFRILKISIPIGSVFAIFLFFGIFQAHKSINPDLSGIEDDAELGVFIMFNSETFGNKHNAKVAQIYSMQLKYTGSNTKQNLIRWHKRYLKSSLLSSILYGSILTLVIPIVVISYNVPRSAYKKSKDWIEEHKTI